jgi:hypothetical protein
MQEIKHRSTVEVNMVVTLDTHQPPMERIHHRTATAKANHKRCITPRDQESMQQAHKELTSPLHNNNSHPTTNTARVSSPAQKSPSNESRSAAQRPKECSPEI